MDKLITAVAAILAGLLILAGVGLLVSYFVMLLWNGCLVPAIPAIVEITWLQAWGIIILFGVLFKSSSDVGRSLK